MFLFLDNKILKDMDYVNKQVSRQITNSIVVNLLSGKFIFGRLTILVNLLSVFISWHFNQSIGYTILHYFFGWWYLLYCTLTLKFANGAFLDILTSYF